jgi:OmpA-OmpF porin, OOP family
VPVNNNTVTQNKFDIINLINGVVMKNITFLVVFFLVTASATFAQESLEVTKYNAFSGTLALGIDGGFTLAHTDYAHTRPDILGRASLEYLFPTTSNGTIGIKAFVSGGYVGGQQDGRIPDIFRTTILNIAVGPTYTLNIQDAVFPYFFAGMSYLHFDPKDVNGIRLPGNAAGDYKRHEFDYLVELGLHFLVTERISLNVAVGGQFSPNDNWDDVKGGGNNDATATFTAGFSYSLFTRKDSDGDGVPDDIDKCPGTPKGVRVDEFGCPIDSDHDGVPDYLDKCPDTPAGVKVDSTGCPLDSDHDGVPDYKDKCSNTPAGVQVDSDGCPLDSDHDGVPDYLDKCPNTAPGVAVDKDGCQIKKEVIKEVVKQIQIQKVVLNGNTNFEFNKAVLLPNAYTLLEPLVKTMKQDSTIKFRVAGYTDAIGSESYNLNLSRRRAQAVVDYLVLQGLDGTRFEVIGLGKSGPVATNSTPEGRAMNRRVEIEAVQK